MTVAYQRCDDCEGTGQDEGYTCASCKGHGGVWIVLGPGISVRVIYGDADNRPDDPTAQD